MGTQPRILENSREIAFIGKFLAESSGEDVEHQQHAHDILKWHRIAERLGEDAGTILMGMFCAARCQLGITSLRAPRCGAIRAASEGAGRTRLP